MVFLATNASSYFCCYFNTIQANPNLMPPVFPSSSHTSILNEPHYPHHAREWPPAPHIASQEPGSRAFERIPLEVHGEIATCISNPRDLRSYALTSSQAYLGALGTLRARSLKQRAESLTRNFTDNDAMYFELKEILGDVLRNDVHVAAADKADVLTALKIEGFHQVDMFPAFAHICRRIAHSPKALHLPVYRYLTKVIGHFDRNVDSRARHNAIKMLQEAYETNSGNWSGAEQAAFLTDFDNFLGNCAPGDIPNGLESWIESKADDLSPEFQGQVYALLLRQVVSLNCDHLHSILSNPEVEEDMKEQLCANFVLTRVGSLNDVYDDCKLEWSVAGKTAFLIARYYAASRIALPPEHPLREEIAAEMTDWHADDVREFCCQLARIGADLLDKENEHIVHEVHHETQGILRDGTPEWNADQSARFVTEYFRGFWRAFEDMNAVVDPLCHLVASELPQNMAYAQVPMAMANALDTGPLNYSVWTAVCNLAGHVGGRERRQELLYTMANRIKFLPEDFQIPAYAHMVELMAGIPDCLPAERAAMLSTLLSASREFSERPRIYVFGSVLPLLGTPEKPISLDWNIEPLPANFAVDEQEKVQLLHASLQAIRYLPPASDLWGDGMREVGLPAVEGFCEGLKQVSGQCQAALCIRTVKEMSAWRVGHADAYESLGDLYDDVHRPENPLHWNSASRADFIAALSEWIGLSDDEPYRVAEFDTNALRADSFVQDGNNAGAPYAALANVVQVLPAELPVEPSDESSDALPAETTENEDIREQALARLVIKYQEQSASWRPSFQSRFLCAFAAQIPHVDESQRGLNFDWVQSNLMAMLPEHQGDVCVALARVANCLPGDERREAHEFLRARYEQSSWPTGWKSAGVRFLIDYLDACNREPEMTVDGFDWGMAQLQILARDLDENRNAGGGVKSRHLERHIAQICCALMNAIPNLPAERRAAAFNAIRDQANVITTDERKAFVLRNAVKIVGSLPDSQLLDAIDQVCNWTRELENLDIDWLPAITGELSGTGLVELLPAEQREAGQASIDSLSDWSRQRLDEFYGEALSYGADQAPANQGQEAGAA